MSAFPPSWKGPSVVRVQGSHSSSDLHTPIWTVRTKHSYNWIPAPKAEENFTKYCRFRGCTAAWTEAALLWLWPAPLTGRHSCHASGGRRSNNTPCPGSSPDIRLPGVAAHTDCCFCTKGLSSPLSASVWLKQERTKITFRKPATKTNYNFSWFRLISIS